MTEKLNLVVAMTRQGVIGRKIPQTQQQAGLPWHQADDLRHFRDLTYGCPCLMGRNTFEHIGRPLAGRLNVVVSRTLMPQADIVVARRFIDAWNLIKDLKLAKFVIGGAELYQQALPLVDRMHVTWIEAEVTGDVYFPKWNRQHWHEQMLDQRAADRDNDHPTTFCEYRRLTLG
jgi:dihydrofolate reductase